MTPAVPAGGTDLPRIYLDYNASTPLAPEVVSAMGRLLEEDYGNPSSTHWAGAPARTIVESARSRVADLLDCRSDEVVFTSGGTEANNAALKGVWHAAGAAGRGIVTSRVEHPAILEPCLWLQSQGAEVTFVEVDGSGRVDPDDVRRAITPRTLLVSVMHANNEVGTLQPVAEVARICREREVLLHVDAAQSVGKVPVSVRHLGVDLLSVAAHKFYGPKGVGALFLRRGTPFEPLLHGAAHEAGRRAGTESALLTAGLGAACQRLSPDPEVAALRDLRDRFWEGLQHLYGEQVVRNGHPEQVLPNTLHVSFRGRTGADVLAALPEVAASTGSACHAGVVRVSHVLAAMGADRDRALGAVRWSLGEPTREDELETVLALLRERLP